MRNFVIALLLICLITFFGCSDSGAGHSSARPTLTPAPGHQANTSSTPLKEDSNRQEKTVPEAVETPAATNKVAESSSSLSSTSPIPQKKSNCDPNYSGCVPIASDVDCANGNGNGPEYVDGPVRVIGDDIYKLDKDGDGIACEN